MLLETLVIVAALCQTPEQKWAVVPDSVVTRAADAWVQIAGQEYFDAHVKFERARRDLLDLRKPPESYETSWIVTYPQEGARCVIRFDIQADGTFAATPPVPPCTNDPESCTVRIDSLQAVAIAESTLAASFRSNRLTVKLNYDHRLKRFLWIVSGELTTDEWYSHAYVELNANDGVVILKSENYDRSRRRSRP